MLIFLVFGFLFVLIQPSTTRDLPEYFPRCYLDDLEFNTCIKKAFNTLRPYVQKGIDEIKFPSLMPLVISRFDILQESTSTNYTANIWNYTLRGFENYNLVDFQYDRETKTFYGAFEFNPILINTVYDAKGQLFYIPIEGDQDVFEGALGPFNATFMINGELVKHEGVDYYRPTRVKVSLDIEDGTYYFHNLFNSKALSKMTNEMLNKNSKMVTDAITPVYERLYELAVMKYVQKLTKMYPYYKLFPLSK